MYTKSTYVFIRRNIKPLSQSAKWKHFFYVVYLFILFCCQLFENVCWKYKFWITPATVHIRGQLKTKIVFAKFSIDKNMVAICFNVILFKNIVSELVTTLCDVFFSFSPLIHTPDHSIFTVYWTFVVLFLIFCWSLDLLITESNK